MFIRMMFPCWFVERAIGIWVSAESQTQSTKIRTRTDQIDQIFHQLIHTTYLCSSVENQAQITVAPGSSDIVLRELVQPQVLSQMDSNGGLMKK